MSLDKTFRALRLDSGAVVTKFDTDVTLAANSNNIVPTQKAVKAYVDSSVTSPDIVGSTNESFTVDYDAVTGKIKIQPTGGSVDKTMTITNEALTDNRTITFPNVTGTVALAADIPSVLLEEVRDVPMSFETGGQMTMKVYFPYKVTINKIRGIVTKAIAGSDNGTITCGNSTGASTTGVITATASDALAVEYSVTPTTNNVVLADGYYYLTSAKSTAGGEVLISLEVTRTA